MASYKIFFPFILVTILCFAIIEAQVEPLYQDSNCSNDHISTITSAFQFNLKTLLSNLSANAIGDTQFYNNTINIGTSASDSAYGAFMCRGDVLSHSCQQCVRNATEQLFSDCSQVSHEGLVWSEDCMVRYSNHSFFSTMDTTPDETYVNSLQASNPESFMRLLLLTLNQTVDEAVRTTSDNKKFATREAIWHDFQTLYCLAQCTPDLSPHDCRTCLIEAIRELPECCEGRLGATFLYPSCILRYEMFPFYRTLSPTPPPALVPATTNTSKDSDSKFSDDPIYLSHNCSSFTTNDTFHIDLMTLLSYLSSNATSGKEFHMADVGDRVYGLFMCQGDLSTRFCGQCVLNATHKISSKCLSFQEGIIWYSHCMLRYSHWNFFNSVDTSPMYSMLNITNTSSPNQEQNFFTFPLSKTLFMTTLEAGQNAKRYQTKAVKLNDLQTLYTLAQCTQDLSSIDCESCLNGVVEIAIPWHRLGSVGGRVLYPSCNLRFELFQFYKDGDDAQSPMPISLSPSPSKQLWLEKRKRGQLRTIILIVVPTLVSVTLLSFGYYLFKRKARKSSKIILRENFGHESATVEPLQFEFAVIKVATNNFSNENRIGKGGFGEVYKGNLDGREVAIKRLSKSSRQGASEFKNEVLLIAKLQHRNLVALIGFCLEEQEKILIYEYVPNKSLDYFLFDFQQQKLLSWHKRYNIIGEIAQGILYLHDHSRLKVIHRDLKPSNILLDENMIPKISDFGLARIVEINQEEGSTNRIVGTLGYMSPEYAMFGQFSEKSDVFSFGVMLLEIITGKKNLSSHGLLNYVWKRRKQTPFNILDPNIEENYSEIEVMRCIQIGLLCVQHNLHARPTMATIVQYLGSPLIELPTPLEPGFFSHGRMDATTITHESRSSQSTNDSTPFSLNLMSISEFHPR